jgi:hypothetical protein
MTVQLTLDGGCRGAPQLVACEVNVDGAAAKVVVNAPLDALDEPHGVLPCELICVGKQVDAAAPVVGGWVMQVGG